MWIVWIAIKKMIHRRGKQDKHKLYIMENIRYRDRRSIFLKPLTASIHFGVFKNEIYCDYRSRCYWSNHCIRIVSTWIESHCFWETKISIYFGFLCQWGKTFSKQCRSLESLWDHSESSNLVIEKRCPTQDKFLA